MVTKKIYYEDFRLAECKAKVLQKDNNRIILDQTVAFPEGGGQEGDRGIIILNNKEIPFVDTKKGVGRVLHLEDFPTIQVDTPVYHFVNEEQMDEIILGEDVIVQIDIAHRIKTTALHSALHIALMAATERMPNKVKTIKGCSITDEYGRLDFFTSERFTPEDIDWLNKRVNEIISQDYPIDSYHHQIEKEAWYWKCNDFVCACGGTHLKRTGEAGTAYIKRKNVGKSTERLIVTLEDIRLYETDFHKMSN